MNSLLILSMFNQPLTQQPELPSNPLKSFFEQDTTYRVIGGLDEFLKSNDWAAQIEGGIEWHEVRMVIMDFYNVPPQGVTRDFFIMISDLPDEKCAKIVDYLIQQGVIFSHLLEATEREIIGRTPLLTDWMQNVRNNESNGWSSL